MLVYEAGGSASLLRAEVVRKDSLKGGFAEGRGREKGFGGDEDGDIIGKRKTVLTSSRYFVV
jgi:hypothetical protein